MRFLLTAFSVGICFLLLEKLCEARHSHHTHPCPKRDSKIAVIRAQNQLFEFTKACEFKQALQMCTSNFSFTDVDAGCGSSCCYTTGEAGTWWGYYDCADQIIYPESPSYVTALKNGTVIYTTTEIILKANDGDTWVYDLRYYWKHIGHCEFRLDYIEGNYIACPAFLPGAVPCTIC